MVHENVAKIREAKGFTKTYIANYLGMSLMGYIHIESGNVRLDVERLRDISIILEVPIHVFFSHKLTETVIKEFLNRKEINNGSDSRVTCQP